MNRIVLMEHFLLNGCVCEHCPPSEAISYVQLLIHKKHFLVEQVGSVFRRHEKKWTNTLPRSGCFINSQLIERIGRAARGIRERMSVEEAGVASAEMLARRF